MAHDNGSAPARTGATVSLVIPMLNEADGLPALLQALAGQIRRPDEIIFVDAGSIDDGPRIIAQWWSTHGWPNGSCTVEPNPGGYPGDNRNVGVRKAAGDWIAFIDCGIYPAADWLAQLLDHARQTGACAVFGMCEFVASGPVARAACALGYGVGSVHPVLPSSIFRHSVFTAVGMFEKDWRAGEDIEWMARLAEWTGPKLVCGKALVQYRSFPDSPAEVAKKNYLYQLSASNAGIGKKMAALYIAGGAVALCAATMPATIPWLAGTYLLARCVVDPIRRSRQRLWWSGQPLSILVLPVVALTVDTAKLAAIVQSLLQMNKKWKGADSEQ